MAVVTRKSTVMTNEAAKVINPAYLAKGSLLHLVGVVESTVDDSIASKYQFGKIPSNALISQILLSCDASDAAAIDIGFYRTDEDGGAVVDVDAIASAQLLTAALKNSDVTYEAQNIDKSEQRLWQLCGLTSDPKCDFVLTATFTVAVTVAGTIVLKAKYAI